MFQIDKAKNEIVPLDVRTFSELGFRERANLQEWIAKYPEALGEELLIIQKEFAGFSDTNERLDLLALDKQGSLVIIENKLDDAGRDVTWQALKYASYCASLSRENIRSIYQEYLSRNSSAGTAEDKLCEFFDVDEFQELSLNKGVTQRIILVAAHFRKEVTSTVLWLMNFNVRLQCFKTTPYVLNDQIFLAIEQIIPTRDAEEFMVGLAAKAQDEVVGAEAQIARHTFRRAFWAQLLPEVNQRTELFRNITTSQTNWISAGSGIRGVGLNFVVTGDACRAELYIDRGKKTDNERVFDLLLEKKEQFEADFGSELVWERLDNRRACRIKAEMPGDIFDKARWPAMIDAMADAMVRLESAFRKQISLVKTALG
ncbi:DUF4268 domain-containing protein [Mesorhizobium sp. M0184]|uniref:DUF4268 domain-containing protein n=1 Tax=Mesorhizobium sp. M0184 TaxID=2956906 RepID=UPI003339D714